MPRLIDLPSGTAVFIDANIFLGHFLQQHPTCTSVLERVWSRDLIGVTSVLVLGEVRHGLLRAEVSVRYALASRQTLRYLREHPRVIAELTKSRQALHELRRWPIRIVNLTRGQFWQACRISERDGLLTNDALIVATMRAHRLTHLASNDSDFLRVPGITLWRP